MRLSPARRLMYGFSLAMAVVGLLQLFSGFGLMRVPIPVALFFVRIRVPAPLFSDGTLWLLGGFLLMNLLVLLEVADRLSLKRDLEVAREIQQAMLPDGTWSGPGVEAFGLTKPANTVGGDFYDILPRPDGTVLVALGDVAGKASPAALLMALLLAILRTLVDEGLPLPVLVRRLNLQVSRHAPASRFITLFLASYDPASGRLSFVNAGQTPPLLRRQSGTVERLMSGGVALGMFEGSTYEQGEVVLHPGDALLMYSDGVTEAESPDGEPFDEAGLERTLALHAGAYQTSAAAVLGRAVFEAVERHRRDQRLSDDLTVLVLSRLMNPIA
jgi:sigma-B regulation protein RsbU (phosphoserine phosphatase)